MTSKLTQSRLMQLLNYDPATGVFSWKIKSGGKKAGSVAGIAHCKGYITIRGDYKYYLAHRLAFLYMKGEMPEFVDHKNGVRNDNRWSNLRPATATENMQNMGVRKDNTSGHSGVYWNRALGKWHVRFKVNKKQCNFGYYENLSDAVIAASEARVKYYGEFAR